MPQVLILAYHFPPIATVGSHRPASYARYLPRSGWEPVVLTRTGDARYPVDDSLMRGIGPGVIVDRITEPHLRHVFGAFTKLGLSRVMRSIERWISLPDDQYGWIAAAYARGRTLIERVRPDAILCSCVPLSSAVAAALLRRATGVPLVLDFHNEWTRNMYFDPPTALHARFQSRLEAWVVERSDAVVTLNPLHSEDYARRFPDVPVTTLHNGYEPEDYAEAVPPAPAVERPVVFTYAGAIYGYQAPTRILEALEALVKSGDLKPGDVEMRILGDPFRAFEGREHSIAVRVERDVPHAELPRRLAEADVCFLSLEEEAARQLPAKIYEYMAARRPTLAVVPPDGAAARLLRETRSGRVVAPGDGEGLRTTLLEMVRSAREGHLESPPPEEREKFRRDRLVEQMAAVLEKVRRT